MRNGAETPGDFGHPGASFLLAPEPLPAQPCLGVGPVLFGGRLGDAQHLGRFGHRAPNEVPQLHQFGLTRRFFREPIQRLVDGQHFRRVPSIRPGQVFQVRILARATAAMFEPSLAAGSLDQDAAHGLGRRGEEVAPAVPAGVLGTDQAEIGLMHQGGRLERLSGVLPGQPLGGQPPQLVIDQGKELLGRPWIAVSGSEKDTGYVVHRSARQRPPGVCPIWARAAPPGGLPSRPECMRGRLDPSLTCVPRRR